jgi:uncharacterized protein (TIGR03435 family)
MLNRFTERARRVLFYARSEVSQVGSSALEPEHLLLGLLREPKGLGHRILARTADAVDGLRGDIAGRLMVHDAIPESEVIPFSASCERALQYAVEEADRLLDGHVGTEHLLLGLLREEDSVAARVLVGRGVRIEAVREAIVEARSRGEPAEPPGPPSTPANTYRWPRIPFAPSRTVHISRSELQLPQEPVINHAGTTFSACGFTLEEIIVRAWEGSRWHVDIPPDLRDGTRFDFLMMLPEPETRATCLGLLRSAIERQFAIQVARETRMRDVYRLTNTNPPGPMLRRYPNAEPGAGFSSVTFSVFTGRSKGTPMFPLDSGAVHLVPFRSLVIWFEEILGGQVVDETALPGIYSFELKDRVETREAFIRLLCEEAGLEITRERREIPTLVVRSALQGQ